ncbi:MAG TPA: class I SAM-dependent methyltransferase [Polyangiaceae bacterium]|nr:class I SAM-dependent methyltransferase [Polyangiaceae bacterium]
MKQEEPTSTAHEQARRQEPPLGELPIADHLLMVNDLGRGEKYGEAMLAKIRPGDVVLEVGTGAGLLSCMAARLGAKHVYTVEQSPVMHEVAKKVFAANGLSDKITLLHAGSEELVALGAIREPVDVFVTETIGAFGLDEGILPIFEHVKPLLSPNAKVIPERVKFKHCLVNMSGIRERIEILEPIFGFDFSALNAERKSNLSFGYIPIDPWREVSTIAETRTYDVTNFAADDSDQEMMVVKSNVCDGMLVWTEFQLSEDVVLDTRCRDLRDSWANVIYMMKRTPVEYGQRCTSQFRVCDDRVSWVLNWNIAPK